MNRSLDHTTLKVCQEVKEESFLMQRIYQKNGTQTSVNLTHNGIRRISIAKDPTQGNTSSESL